MSNSIDNQIVQMRFDNAQFERGAKESMGTIEKLKKSLTFDKTQKAVGDFAKTLTSLPTTAVSKSLDAIQNKFSGFGTFMDQAIRNLEMRVESSVRNMVNQLNVFQNGIKTGFAEYETQVNATQTIWANTKDAGTTMDDITKALDELNKYADQTIYNFTQMTENIGRFTAAGVNLQDSVDAIQGIANLGALSGSTPMQVSTAMYQLSQALASGSVKLMDWNSVVNASMGGKLFQDLLLDTATELGVMGDTVEAVKNGTVSFRESLIDGWITSDVLITSLRKLTDENTEIGKTAIDAATKVKTFTQTVDTLKEAVQSSWSQSFRTIIGDFEEARGFFTVLKDNLEDLIAPFGDARNAALDFWASADAEGNKVLGESAEDAEKTAKLVEEIWAGAWGNGEERFRRLTEAGYDYRKIQNEVNKSAGMAPAFDIEAEDAKKIEDLEAQVRELEKNRQFAEAEEIRAQIANLKGLDNVMTGREMFFKGLYALGSRIRDVIHAIGEAWSEVFTGVTGKDLVDFSKRFMDWATGIDLTGEKLENLKSIFRGIFSILGIAKEAISIPFKILRGVIESVFADFGGVIPVLADVGDFLNDVYHMLKETSAITDFVDLVVDAITVAVEWIWGFISSAYDAVKPFFEDVLGGAASFIDGIVGLFSDGADEAESDSIKVSNALDKAAGRNIRSGSFTRGAKKDRLRPINETTTTAIAPPDEEQETTVDKFKEFLKYIGKVFDNIKMVVGKIAEAVSFIWGKVTEIISPLLSKMVDAVKNSDIFVGIKALIETLVEADWGEVLDAVLTGGAAVTLWRMSSFFNDLADGFGNMTASLKRVANSFAFENYTKSILLIVASLGVMVAVMAGILALMDHYDEDEIKAGFLLILGFIAEILTMVFAVVGANTLAGGGMTLAASLVGVAIALVGIAAALTIMLIPIGAIMLVMGTIGQTDKGEEIIWKSLAVLGSILGVLAAFITAIAGFGRLFSGKGSAAYSAAANLAAAAVLIMAVAVAINLVLVPIMILGVLASVFHAGDAIKSGAILVGVIMGGIVLMVGMLMWFLSRCKGIGNVGKAALTILSMSVLILALATAIDLMIPALVAIMAMTILTGEKGINAVVKILEVLFLGIAGIMLIASNIKSNPKKISKLSLLMLSTVGLMVTMIYVLKEVKGVKWQQMMSFTAVLGVIFAGLDVMMGLLNKNKMQTKTFAKKIGMIILFMLSIAGLLVAMKLVLKDLANTKWSQLLSFSAILAVIFIGINSVIGAVEKTSSRTNTLAKKMASLLLLMAGISVVVLALAGAIKLIQGSNLSFGQYAGFLAGLVVIFAGLAVLSKMNVKGKSIGKMVALAVSVALIVAALALAVKNLKGVELKSLLGFAGVLLAIGGAMVLLAAAGKILSTSFIFSTIFLTSLVLISLSIASVASSIGSLMGAMTALMTTVKGMSKSEAKKAGRAASGALSGFVEGLLDENTLLAIRNFFDLLGNIVFDAIWNALHSLVKELPVFIEELVPAIYKIADLAPDLVAAIDKLLENVALSIETRGTNIMMSLKRIAKSLWNSFCEVFPEVGEFIDSLFGDAEDSVADNKEGIISDIRTIVDTICGIIETIATTAASVIQGVASGIKWLNDLVFSFGRDPVTEAAAQANLGGYDAVKEFYDYIPEERRTEELKDAYGSMMELMSHTMYDEEAGKWFVADGFDWQRLRESTDVIVGAMEHEILNALQKAYGTDKGGYFYDLLNLDWNINEKIRNIDDAQKMLPAIMKEGALTPEAIMQYIADSGILAEALKEDDSGEFKDIVDRWNLVKDNDGWQLSWLSGAQMAQNTATSQKQHYEKTAQYYADKARDEGKAVEFSLGSDKYIATPNGSIVSLSGSGKFSKYSNDWTKQGFSQAQNEAYKKARASGKPVPFSALGTNWIMYPDGTLDIDSSLSKVLRVGQGIGSGMLGILNNARSAPSYSPPKTSSPGLSSSVENALSDMSWLDTSTDGALSVSSLENLFKSGAANSNYDINDIYAAMGMTGGARTYGASAANEKMNVYLDSGELVGAIAPKMDVALGKRATVRARVRG